MKKKNRKAKPGGVLGSAFYQVVQAKFSNFELALWLRSISC